MPDWFMRQRHKMRCTNVKGDYKSDPDYLSALAP